MIRLSAFQFQMQDITNCIHIHDMDMDIENLYLKLHPTIARLTATITLLFIDIDEFAPSESLGYNNHAFF